MDRQKASCMKIKNRESPEKFKTVREIQNANFRQMEGEGNERKFIISFSSETPVQRYDGAEILDHSDGAIDLQRLSDTGVVLFNHNRDYVVGRINRVWVEESRGCAEIEFDTDNDAEKIFQKVKCKTLRGVSIGYIIKDIEKVSANSNSSDGRFTGPCYIARKWMPYEISIVSVPADPNVGVGRSEESEKIYYRSLAERQLLINQNNIL